MSNNSRKYIYMEEGQRNWVICQVVCQGSHLVSEHGCTDFTDLHQIITTWVMKKFDQKDGIAIIDKLAGFGWVNCGLLAF